MTERKEMEQKWRVRRKEVTRYNWSASWKDGGNGSRETEGRKWKGRLIYKRSASWEKGEKINGEREGGRKDGRKEGKKEGR